MNRILYTCSITNLTSVKHKYPKNKDVDIKFSAHNAFLE